MGRLGAQDHHDRYADRPSMVHLRHSQGRLPSPTPSLSGNARFPQGQARRQTEVDREDSTTDNRGRSKTLRSIIAVDRKLYER